MGWDEIGSGWAGQAIGNVAELIDSPLIPGKRTSVGFVNGSGSLDLNFLRGRTLLIRPDGRAALTDSFQGYASKVMDLGWNSLGRLSRFED
ncbi:hypothetical protein BTUL_0019g00050 [Botrytis tulipae]|uniref:Uncharacterized protein n=1 Tax=Botrytis tulipae TaxID=87230 RepID=A0A4Z1EYH0_9HELO|nr:hypothetical protein BTUL_0019g00050 [Botrytis tulipae]